MYEQGFFISIYPSFVDALVLRYLGRLVVKCVNQSALAVKWIVDVARRNIIPLNAGNSHQNRRSTWTTQLASPWWMRSTGFGIMSNGSRHEFFRVVQRSSAYF